MHRLARSLLVFCALILTTQTLAALEAPALRTRVTDPAGVLSSSDRGRLEQKLAAYEQSTGNQFVVLIVSSLEGESIEDYSMKVAEANKIGQKGTDNGLLLLIAIQDRKLRFEVGYGLEGVLTDALTSVIIREVIAPQFKRGNYAQGISDGIDAAIKAVSGEFTPPETRSPKKRSKGVSFGGIVMFIIIIVVVSLLRRRGGGGFWFIGGLPGGGWGSSSGDSWGGDSGGFGGFDGGGGSFGGGGSSGDW